MAGDGYRVNMGTVAGNPANPPSSPFFYIITRYENMFRLNNYPFSSISSRRHASTSVSSFFENVNRSFTSPPSW